MEDYSKGKIYKILCKITAETYYGSTIRKLKDRLNDHKTHPDESAVRSILKRGNYDMLLVEDFNCNNKTELLWRERWWIENNECVNIRLPIHTPEEIRQSRLDYSNSHNATYYEEKRQQILEQKKEYYKTNKDKIDERKKEKITCDCGSVVSRCCLSQHRKTKKHLNYLKILDSESESDTESMKEWKEAENIQGYDDIN